MTIKKILAMPVLPASLDALLGSAACVSDKNGASITVGVSKSSEAAELLSGYEGVVAYLSDQAVKEIEAEVENRIKEFREIFEEAAKKAGLLLDGIEEPATRTTARWVETERYEADFVARYGAAYDLIIVSQPSKKGSKVELPTLETALFLTGRPVLVAPQEPPTVVGKTVVIGWNRSGQAARAFHAAKALLLQQSERVVILSVETGAKEGPTADEIADTLHQHSIDAEVRLQKPDNRSVATVLMDQAANIGADLVVMGAYSHSRMRQVILGGVTRQILSEATVPVLMAH